MEHLIEILNYNGIKYYLSNYANYESIVIKKNSYQLEIFKDDIGFVSDLQKIPYTWGIMGSTSLSEIFEDLRIYLGIDIKYFQISLF